MTRLGPWAAEAAGLGEDSKGAGVDGAPLVGGVFAIAQVMSEGVGMSDSDNQSRRGFLGATCVAVPAVALAGGGSSTASAAEGAPKRRTVGGSPIAVFSRATVFDRLVYASGVVGNKPGTLEMAGDSFKAQCRQAMENLKDSVEAAGAKMENALKCTCFLTDVSDFEEFNEIYRGYFPSAPPARSTVVVKELVVSGAKLEIDCVACLV